MRIVAATNRDLEQRRRQREVPRGPVLPAERRSRSTLPPLRERRDDIVAAGRRTSLRRFARAHGGSIARLAPEAMRRSRPTPGRATCASSQTSSSARSSPRATVRSTSIARCPHRETPDAEPYGPKATILTADDLARIERDNIRRALDADRLASGGRARSSPSPGGWPPSTLASRMKALGVRKPS